MKATVLFAALLCNTLLLLGLAAFGQGTPDSTESGLSHMALGDGLNFRLDNYKFKISGMLQPAIRYTKPDGQTKQLYLNTKRTYLNFTGSALKERISFFVQVDFSASTPLLDAYATYNFLPRFSLSAGQKRTFTNNREFTYNEDRLQFNDRSQLSNSFAGNGREFGLFLEGKIGNAFMLHPQAAVTSGDGPNSFGLSAADVDQGGLKYGGRLDIYPLGDFKEGNRGFTADLRHEETPKLVIGAAGSFNQGASHSKGEGHGNFQFFDANKNQKLPDYRKLYADLLVKYQGFSLLAEYVNATASGLQGTYTDSSSGAAYLKPGQISQYLSLGNAYNVALGYTAKGWSLDVRYESLRPEFVGQTGSVLQQQNTRTVGLTRYLNENKVKMQASVSSVRYTNGVNTVLGELMMQVVF